MRERGGKRERERVRDRDRERGRKRNILILLEICQPTEIILDQNVCNF